MAPSPHPALGAARRAPRLRVPAWGVGLVALVGACVALAAGPSENLAAAQTTGTGPSITVNPLVTRTLPNGDTAPTRSQGLNPTGISFDDCEKDVTLNFSLTLGGLPQPNLHVEAWVGSSDCTDLASRTSTTATCKPAAPLGISLSQTVSVHIKARDIVANQADNPKPVTYTAAPESACTSAQTTSGATSLSVYFLWLDGSGNSQGTAAKYDLKADLVGPAAPTNVSAGDGDRILVVNWNPTADTDTYGFQVFCDPSDGLSTVTDGGASDAAAASSTQAICVDGGFSDGGVDDAGNPLPGEAIDGGCRFINVTDAGSAAGDPTCPAPTMKNVCASVGGNTSTSTVVDGRTNGVRYTVSVAATDGFGNSGPPSTASCATPGPVNDFFNRYRDDGGGAGGGFCALERVGAKTSLSIFGVTGLTAIAVLARRRRQRGRR